MSLAGLTGTVVIGGGQAGLALSYLLRDADHPHVVLERGRIGERWRSERWDSLTLLTPGWLNRLPGEPPPDEPDGFSTREELVDRLEAYAWSKPAPVVEGVTVLRIEPHGAAHRVVTERGDWLASSVVDATGDCAIPVVPRTRGALPVPAIHAAGYRSPLALPAGGVLVVGAGPTGQQLALELAADGRRVVLAVGRHARVPRRTRGRDIWRWLADLGDLDRTIDDAPDPFAARRSPSFPLNGADGGRQLDLAVLQGAGVRLTGRLIGFDRGGARFADDLPSSVSDADRRLRRLLARIDALDPTPDGPHTRLDPIDAVGAPTRLDLRAERIESVLWATGFRRDVAHLPEAALDRAGELDQRRGVTAVPGLYVLGARYQHRLSSHLIGGVGADAAYLADRLTAERRRSPVGRSRQFAPAPVPRNRAFAGR